MPLLSFEVYSNYEEVARLRSEITMLENRLRSFGPGTSVSTIRAVEAQLQSARAKFRGLALDAAQAGASLELNIRKGANGAIAAINDLQQKLTDPIQGLTQIAGVAGLGMFLNNVTKIRGQFQLMETNINTLLGGAEKGQAMMAELTEYAKVSPLDFQGTVGAAQMMLGFGIDQQKILPFMKALGDVSMGDAQRFQSLTLAFSQMSAAGKLMGQDLMQMVNAGFQPLDQLAKDTGKSIGQLKDEMSQGKISAEMVQQAFINATSEGGKFYNMSQAATATITGQMSMLGDATDLMFNDLGKKSEDAIIKVIEGATWMVENYEKVGGVLGTAIATFGIYKASAMASEFAIKVASEERSKAVVQGFEEEIAKMEEYQRQRALLAFDEDVRSALETGSISSEMAEKIQALREEVGMRKRHRQPWMLQGQNRLQSMMLSRLPMKRLTRLRKWWMWLTKSELRKSKPQLPMNCLQLKWSVKPLLPSLPIPRPAFMRLRWHWMPQPPSLTPYPRFSRPTPQMQTPLPRTPILLQPAEGASLRLYPRQETRLRPWPSMPIRPRLTPVRKHGNP